MPFSNTPPGSATVFLAHSSADIKAARLVRNLFEERDHDVLLLKLSQQMSQEYLRELLTREIQARDWLVMLESPNADSSIWVTFERHFAELQSKPVFEINIDVCVEALSIACREHLRTEVGKISRRIRVYLCYRPANLDLAKRIARDLQVKGFEVWLDTAELRSGDQWVDGISSGAIDAALERGAFVMLASASAFNARVVRNELDYALSKKGRIILCMTGTLRDTIPTELRSKWIDFTWSYEDGLKELERALDATTTEATPR